MSLLALQAPPPAHEPPEARGLTRDDVGLLVAQRAGGALTNTGFAAIGEHLREGDLVVVNTSATLPAAVPGELDGETVLVHFSTPADDGPKGATRWAVELRAADGTRRTATLGATVTLSGGARAQIISPLGDSERLAVAELALGAPVLVYLHAHGQPIRYRHAPRRWPLEAYQTVWSRHPGSAEMPSAGRPFTDELVTELISAGVRFAPVLLHAGVSSLEAGEDPFPERVRVVDGLITGWHDADASHLRLLEAIAGPELLTRAYEAAMRHGHRGHEFGDVNLILP